MGFVYIIIGVLIAILGIATGAIVIKVHDKNDTPMFITTSTDNELERMRERLETANDEKRNAYKLITEMRDKIQELKTEHGYVVSIIRTNNAYSSYSFVWKDEFIKDIKNSINRLMVGDIDVLELYDNNKTIYLRDDDILNIVVSKEDE